jgi:hypothetical protein
MKQLLQNIKTGKSTVEDVPMPAPREGQALVKTEASLVSAGTERMVVEFAEKSLVGKARSRPDLVKQVIEKARREGVVNTAQAAFNRLDQPMALGYSSAGTIIALGKNMQGFKVGQRVACAGGGYAVHAEYNVVPRNLLTPLPKNVDFESAAFTTLGAISLHGFRLAEPQIGENVAVIGMGLLGLLTAQIATAAGCQRPRHRRGPRPHQARCLSWTSSCPPHPRRGLICRVHRQPRLRRDHHLRGHILKRPGRAGRSHRPRPGPRRCHRRVGLTFPRKVYYEKEISFINSRSYGPGRYDLATKSRATIIRSATCAGRKAATSKLSWT